MSRYFLLQVYFALAGSSCLVIKDRIVVQALSAVALNRPEYRIELGLGLDRHCPTDRDCYYDALVKAPLAKLRRRDVRFGKESTDFYPGRETTGHLKCYATISRQILTGAGDKIETVPGGGIVKRDMTG